MLLAIIVSAAAGATLRPTIAHLSLPQVINPSRRGCVSDNGRSQMNVRGQPVYEVTHVHTLQLELLMKFGRTLSLLGSE